MPPVPDRPSIPTRTPDQLRCFQLVCRDGVRLVHHTDRTTTSITGDQLFSLCGEEFPANGVESTSQPGTAPAPGEAEPGRPCVGCRIALMHRRARDGDPRDKYLTWLLLQGQWLLSDAQLALHRATLTEPEHHTIATVLSELSQVLRERAHREFGEPSG